LRIGLTGSSKIGSRPPLNDPLKLRKAVRQWRWPWLQIKEDLISYMCSYCTAGVRSKPARASTRSGRNFLPHHEPMIRSGSRATTSSAVTTRSLAALRLPRSANWQPADSTRAATELACLPSAYSLPTSSSAAERSRGSDLAFARRPVQGLDFEVRG